MSSEWGTRISAKALSRERSFFALATPYVETNANDDHGRPGREDYSILLLAPDTIDETVTQPAWTGPWITRRSGTATTATSVRATRRPGTTTTATSVRATRRTGTTTTATSARATRRTGTTTTATSAWASRRTGTATT